MDKRKDFSVSYTAGKNYLTPTVEYSYSETEQTARATIGGGTIIVRDNPNMDLFGLNRDTSQAMTQETTANVNLDTKSVYEAIDHALSAPDYLRDATYAYEEPEKFFKEKWTEFTTGVEKTKTKLIKSLESINAELSKWSKNAGSEEPKLGPE